MGRFQGNACPHHGSEVAHGAHLGPWTRAIWARAAAPAIPSVQEIDGHLTSEGTSHHAHYVGSDRWVVDYLPGRQLTREQATAAMRIAIAPERLEVDRWAGLLGLTAAEARGFAELPVGA